MKTIIGIREITKSNQLDINQALEQIENRAKCGESSCLFTNLSDNAFKELLTLGFKLSKFIDPIGIEVIRIEW